MNKQLIEDFSNELAESARCLLAATADAAGNGVQQARAQLESTLEDGKAAFAQAKNCAGKSLCIVDAVARTNPYALAGAALVLGLVIAFTVKPFRK